MCIFLFCPFFITERSEFIMMSLISAEWFRIVSAKTKRTGRFNVAKVAKKNCVCFKKTTREIKSVSQSRPRAHGQK